MRPLQIPLLLSLSILLTSCKEVFAIKAEPIDGMVGFTFYNDGLLGKEKIVPCLKNFRVYQGNDKSGNSLWKISPTNGDCTPVGIIYIGKVPKGFQQIEASVPLTVGPTYAATAEDGQFRMGFSNEFKLLNSERTR